MVRYARLAMLFAVRHQAVSQKENENAFPDDRNNCLKKLTVEVLVSPLFHSLESDCTDIPSVASTAEREVANVLGIYLCWPLRNPDDRRR